jgi:hypothetical protein
MVCTRENADSKATIFDGLIMYGLKLAAARYPVPFKEGCSVVSMDGVDRVGSYFCSPARAKASVYRRKKAGAFGPGLWLSYVKR